MRKQNHNALTQIFDQMRTILNYSLSYATVEKMRFTQCLYYYVCNIKLYGLVSDLCCYSTISIFRYGAGRSSWARESPIFAERFALVDTPQEYYTITSFIDLIEFLYRLNKTEMINAEIWSRWKAKFKTVWDKTKDIHTAEFRHFIDSL